MARRKIKRKRGEGVLITGPATVHVSRRVMLIIDAPEEARIARLAKQPRTAAPPARGRIPGKHGPSPPIAVEDESSPRTSSAETPARCHLVERALSKPRDEHL